MQAQLHISVTWKYQECVQHHVPFFDSVDWDFTILNLHQGNLPGSLATSVSMCSDCTYRVKVLHGMLPTASRLFLTCPDLYHDDLCPCCLVLPETADHLWLCTHSQRVLGSIYEEGSNLFWDLVTASHLGHSFYKPATIFPGPHSIIDAVKGIVPLEWVNILCTIGLSLVQAKSVALKVRMCIVAVAQKQVW